MYAIRSYYGIFSKVFVDPAGKFPELVGRVVAGGNYQVYNLHMDPELLCKQGGFEYRSQFCTAHIPIEFFGKCLYVRNNFV